MADFREPGMTTGVAGEDLTGKERLAVKIDTDGIKVCGAGEEAIGILAQGQPAGRTVTIATRLDWGAIYGATVVRGVKLMSDANGKLITRTATNAVVGTAMAAGAANEQHTVHVNPQAVLA